MTDAGIVHVHAAWGWVQLPHPEPGVMEFHLLPVADVGAHAFDHECRCCPKREGIWFFVHYAFDGREAYETGARKVN